MGGLRFNHWPEMAGSVRLLLLLVALVCVCNVEAGARAKPRRRRTVVTVEEECSPSTDPIEKWIIRTNRKPLVLAKEEALERDATIMMSDLGESKFQLGEANDDDEFDQDQETGPKGRRTAMELGEEEDDDEFDLEGEFTKSRMRKGISIGKRRRRKSVKSTASKKLSTKEIVTFSVSMGKAGKDTFKMKEKVLLGFHEQPIHDKAHSVVRVAAITKTTDGKRCSLSKQHGVFEVEIKQLAPHASRKCNGFKAGSVTQDCHSIHEANKSSKKGKGKKRMKQGMSSKKGKGKKSRMRKGKSSKKGKGKKSRMRKGKSSKKGKGKKSRMRKGRSSKKGKGKKSRMRKGTASKRRSTSLRSSMTASEVIAFKTKAHVRRTGQYSRFWKCMKQSKKKSTTTMELGEEEDDDESDLEGLLRRRRRRKSVKNKKAPCPDPCTKWWNLSSAQKADKTLVQDAKLAIKYMKLTVCKEQANGPLKCAERKLIIDCHLGKLNEKVNFQGYGFGADGDKGANELGEEQTDLQGSRLSKGFPKLSRRRRSVKEKWMCDKSHKDLIVGFV